MDSRQRLHRAMNQGRAPHSPETQEITLMLHDLAVEYAAEGWTLGYEIADDSPRIAPDGTEIDNLALFAEDQRRNWGEVLARRSLADDDARDDLELMPKSGQHVLIQLVHQETGAQVIHWIDRSELHALVVGDGKGRVARRADISRAVSRGDALPAIDAVRALVAPARDAAEARVARKQDRLKSAGTGQRER